MKKYLLSLISVGLMACNGAKNEPSEVPFVQALQQDSTLIEDIVDDYWYPTASEMSVPIMTTGEVFLSEDEIDPKDADKGWFGVFRFRDKAFVEATRVNIVPNKKDGSNRTTSWNITTSHIDTAIILVHYPKLQPHEMQWVRLPKAQLQPNEKQSFTFDKQTYTLYATGLPFEDKAPLNYKLYLKGMKNGKEIDQLVVSIPSFDKEDSMVSILFVGDIDSDGMPDLILDATHNYNIYIPTLYLSSLSDADELVKPVGQSVYTY